MVHANREREYFPDYLSNHNHLSGYYWPVKGSQIDSDEYPFSNSGKSIDLINKKEKLSFSLSDEDLSAEKRASYLVGKRGTYLVGKRASYLVGRKRRALNSLKNVDK